MKIAVTLNDDGTVNHVNDTNEDAAIKQSKYDGWKLVESDPAFLVEQAYIWTVRQSDNKLVHIATGLTPDEENQKSNTELTNLVIAQGTDIEQIKQSITALTNMQLGTDTTK
ncbi:hypothetical protein [Companilactobacillus nantensis]|uniref:Uncharacterized protein n=1 Tax=Companilactobacillus nantensis DSM 16982 TaxID=1423774 RepID=A0A0R1WDA1_9LACO|nr:hypothetical protein [Companilactobacillus nantensis]KRM15904.1 hypothetical protein FD31_GL000799 [Companilactobacillus nantensis DSM 16982]GEO64764.1 hypothetical protein LNA01_19470 [Companilactobacillus nantensis]